MQAYLSAHQRKDLIKELSTDTYDILVIGGGITGAGIALDAASRGFKTALVEKIDFASGTSSRSTKLIHGGLRYLKQFEIALVREVGRERAIVHSLAPHLVTSEKMLLPIIEGGTFGKIGTSVGLMVYDILAGVESEDQRVMLSKEETLKKEPLLDEKILKGSGVYAEYRTDDARLTIEIVKAAAKAGAHLVNYMLVEDFIYNDKGKVIGARCLDKIYGDQVEIKAKYTVSAAGPWVDKLRTKNNSLQGKKLHLTKGVHLVVPHEKLPIKQAVYFDVPDGRMIFAIPRGKITYIGTTDTDYHGDIDRVITTKGDAEYLIDAVNTAFPDIQLQLEDVISNWAGLRPLIHEEGKSASSLSRKDEVFESQNGLISIAGGKLTGYRKMAEKIIELVANRMKDLGEIKKVPACKTDKIPLGGGAFQSAKNVNTFISALENELQPLGLDAYHAWYLVSNYGHDAQLIKEHIQEFQRENPDPEQCLARAELKYAIENEMVQSALDFFIRRTGRLYFDIQSIFPVKDVIMKDLADYFEWSKEKAEKEKKKLEIAIQDAVTLYDKDFITAS